MAAFGEGQLPDQEGQETAPRLPASTIHQEGKWANLTKARVRLSEPSFTRDTAIHNPAYHEGKHILKPPKNFFFLM